MIKIDAEGSTGELVLRSQERSIAAVRESVLSDWGASPMQVWQSHTFGIGSNSLNSAWRFKGNLHVDCLTRAAAEISKRHSILRCAFKYVAEAWHFVSEGAKQFGIYNLDASGGQDPEAEAMELLREAIWRPFCLEVEGPFRIISVRIGPEDYLVGFVFYHAMADGDSLRIFTDELATAYDALVRAQQLSSQDLPFQYLEYRASIEDWNNGSRVQELLSDWVQYLDGVPKIQASYNGTWQSAQFMLSQTSSMALRELSQIEQIGISRIWEAMYHVTLWRLVGETDVVTLGIYNLRHRRSDLANMIGPIVNLLPNRARWAGEVTFRQLLRRSREAKFKTLEYRVLPFRTILERCSLATILPVFNYIPSQIVPDRPAQGEVSPSNGQMTEYSGKRFIVAPPSDILQLSLKGNGCGLTVYDQTEFGITCSGSIRTPFTLAQLVRNIELVAEAVVANMDCTIASLLAPAEDHDEFERQASSNNFVVIGAR